MYTSLSYDASETSEELFSGYANTEYLVDHGANLMSAQYLCESRGTNDGQINDWYLPSKDELYQLWKNMTSTLKFISDDDFEPMEEDQWYWSSSLYSDDEAWMRDYSNLSDSGYGDISESHKVRCIRMVQIPFNSTCD